MGDEDHAIVAQSLMVLLSYGPRKDREQTETNCHATLSAEIAIQT